MSNSLIYSFRRHDCKISSCLITTYKPCIWRKNVLLNPHCTRRWIDIELSI